MNRDLTARTDAIFAAWDRPDTPGCALGVVREGELVYFRGYGRANLDYGLPITSRTVFDIASTSKQFTAACIALLQEQGLLNIDDDVRHHLPELPAFDHTITVAHLIHHTSGWRDYLTLMEFAGYRDQDYISVAEVMALLQKQRGLNFAPGMAYQYCNTGYFLMGQLVERLSGQTLAEFAKQHIFQPLGMHHSHFQDDQTRIVPNRASGYEPAGSGGYRLFMSTLDMVGDGGLMTCVDDLLLWDRNFYDNKLGRGAQALIDLMTTATRFNDGTHGSYGFGLELTPFLGLRCVSHAGWWAGYRAELLRFPDQAFSVICLANTNDLNPTAHSLQVAALWLAGDIDPPAASSVPGRVAAVSPAGDITALAGLYHTTARDRFVVITAADDTLSADFGGEAKPLTPGEDGRWRSDATDYLLEFSFSDDGLFVSADGVPYGHFERMAGDTMPPAPADSYSGSYVSPELATVYKVSETGDGLSVSVAGRTAEPLRHLHEHAFQMGDRTLRFEPDDQTGRAAAFTLSSPRAQGLRFVRREHSFGNQ